MTKYFSKDDKVISDFIEVLGDANVFVASEKLAKFENTTFKTNNNVRAALFPKTSKEVQECVRIANEYKIPLYPISKGKNWGYGSQVPAADGCAVISMEGMNNIADFNEEMAYVTVEPGVTFQQINNYLKEKNSQLIAPGIGSTKDASLIGNALERGIGKGAYGDRFQYSCNMEVVLPNGEIINTGFGNIKNSHSSNIYKWGVGPSIDGIFTQSNFGIVTKMTFWLNKKPEDFRAVFYMVKDHNQLKGAIDTLRELRLEGTLTTTAILSNSHRILSMKQQFPWGKVKGEKLSTEYITQVESSLQSCKWVGDDALLSPTRAIGKAREKRLKQALRDKMHKVVVIDETRAKFLKKFWKPIKLLTGTDVRDALYFFYNSHYLGKATEKQLGICYWSKKISVPENPDPDSDKCGMIWCCPSVPFDGRHMQKVIGIIESVFKEYPFEPSLGFNFMSDRSIAFTAAIIYDREVTGQDEKAMECYREMRNKLMEAGYPSYRLGIQSMDEMLTTSPEYNAFINRLKYSIDPNNIISPNHYGIKGKA